MAEESFDVARFTLLTVHEQIHGLTKVAGVNGVR